MPTSWLFLQGAPSAREVLADSKPRPGSDAPAVERDNHHEAWLLLASNATAVVPGETIPSTDNEVIADSQERTFEDAEDGDGDTSAIPTDMLEQSQAGAPESQSRRFTYEDSLVKVPPGSRRIQGNTVLSEQASYDSFSESLLPPPTQNQRRSRVGDQSDLLAALGNITEEQSLLNLPSWSFSIASLTSLNALPLSKGQTGFNAPRVNLLALIDELELPSTMPVKNRAPSARSEVTRASMSLVDETGATLHIIMWDAYADEWAGKHLVKGDVVYLEKIALSEYRGQRQGSTASGSKVQVCYRTAGRAHGRRTDPALQPELELDWDPISLRVKALAQLATDL